MALIAVNAAGENQIVVASGANGAVRPEHLPARIEAPLIQQLEIPLDTVAAAVQRAAGFVCLNLAPATAMPEAVLHRADLLVVNDLEAAFYGAPLTSAPPTGAPGLVAITHGARGASLYRGGALVCEAAPPPVTALDTTGCGDTFVGALTVALLEGMPEDRALAFACAAGALAATKAGAQTSLPSRAEVEALIGR